MYGDLESCDSTIKLGEFCSWRGVVPTTLYAPPSTLPLSPLSFSPFHRYLRFDSPYLPRHPSLFPLSCLSPSSLRLSYAWKYLKEDSRTAAPDPACVILSFEAGLLIAAAPRSHSRGKTAGFLSSGSSEKSLIVELRARRIGKWKMPTISSHCDSANDR